MADVAKALRDDLRKMWATQSELTNEERMTLGRFLESYDDEWMAHAFMAGMDLKDAERTAQKLKQ